MGAETTTMLAMHGSVVITSLVVHGVLAFWAPGIQSYIAGSFLGLLLGPAIFLAIAQLVLGPEAFWPIAFFVIVFRTWYIPLLVGIPIHAWAAFRMLEELKRGR